MKLRQVCCDPRLVAVDAARRRARVGEVRRAYSSSSTSSSAQGRRVLVFSQFAACWPCSRRGSRARTSATWRSPAPPPIARSRRHLHEGSADVFLISLKAGGTGLNLTSADTVIHYDPWWNPAAQAQATDRAYRIGQKRPVFVYNLIAPASVEERMLALQQTKRHLADAIIGPVRSPAVLSQDDVENLFAPLTS